ncbi:hypothetical protein LTR10_001019 [Elasticomyces elasticus]|nr:hypothetical protein LTR10_001019 [Elasticomyces elasticus]KAK4979733.1 hypothetical protein LTR42_000039 [Elasticomyces elasticus]
MDYDHDQMEGAIYHGVEAHITNLGRSRAKGDIDQDSAALQDKHSRFLSLPRELRDHIYEYTTWDITFRGQDTEDEAFFLGEITNTTSLDVTVTGVADLGLLHASHQFHDEYVACVRARSRLLIATPNGFPSLSGLDVSANIPSAVLSNIKKIEIRVGPWDAVVDAIDHLYDWLHGATEWTPSRALRTKLVDWLNHLAAHVHPEASVEIFINFDQFQDPSDPYTWMYKDGEYKFENDTHRAFDQDTIFSLEHDTTIAWPSIGKLVVSGEVQLPLRCPRAKNPGQIVACRRSWEVGEGTLRAPDVGEWNKLCGEQIMVRLRPTKNASSWRGFEPEITKCVEHFAPGGEYYRIARRMMRRESRPEA